MSVELTNSLQHQQYDEVKLVQQYQIKPRESFCNDDK